MGPHEVNGLLTRVVVTLAPNLDLFTETIHDAPEERSVVGEHLKEPIQVEANMLIRLCRESIHQAKDLLWSGAHKFAHKAPLREG